MWLLLRVTRTIKPGVCKIAFTVIEREFFFWSNVFQCLKDNHVPSADIGSPRRHVRSTGRVDESRPITRASGIDNATIRDYETV